MMNNTLINSLTSDQIHSIWEDTTDETHTRYLIRTHTGLWYHSDWDMDRMKPCLTEMKFDLNHFETMELQKTMLNLRDVYELIELEMII